MRAYAVLGERGLGLIVSALSPALAAVRYADEAIRWRLLPLVLGPPRLA